MRAFVTGATGFVGSHLVDALLRRGDDVTVLVRNPSKAHHLFPDPTPRLVVGNLSDETALEEGCLNAEVVYHGAALTAARSRAEFFATNDRATGTLLDTAARVAPQLHRFVFLSSLSAAGPTVAARPIADDAPARPVSDYGASKLAGEARVRRAAVPWTIARPPAVYGPRDRELLRIFRYGARGAIPIIGDGAQGLSVVHVRDLVGALLALPDHPTAAGRVYYPAHRDAVTARDLAEAIGGALVRQGRCVRRPAVVPLPRPVAYGLLATIGAAAHLAGVRTLLSADKAREFLATAWTCSPTTLEEHTGWRAEVPLEQGLDETVAWYAAEGWL